MLYVIYNIYVMLISQLKKKSKDSLQIKPPITLPVPVGTHQLIRNLLPAHPNHGLLEIMPEAGGFETVRP